jgi:hypothetical protein
MSNEEEWWSDFKGVEFQDIATEFQYHKIAREIDAIDSIEVIRAMMKNYVRIHLKEKELWKKLAKDMSTPLNNVE